MIQVVHTYYFLYDLETDKYISNDRLEPTEDLSLCKPYPSMQEAETGRAKASWRIRNLILCNTQVQPSNIALAWHFMNAGHLVHE